MHRRRNFPREGPAVLAYTNSTVLPHLRRAVEESEGATVPMSSLYWAALLLTNQVSRQRLAARQRISQEIAVRGACDGDNTA